MLRIRLLGKCALCLTHFPKSRRYFLPELLFCSYIPRHQINWISILSYLYNITFVFKAVITAIFILDCFLLTSSRALCPSIIFNGNTMFSLSSWGAGFCFHMSTSWTKNFSASFLASRLVTWGTYLASGLLSKLATGLITLSRCLSLLYSSKSFRFLRRTLKNMSAIIFTYMLVVFLSTRKRQTGFFLSCQ